MSESYVKAVASMIRWIYDQSDAENVRLSMSGPLGWLEENTKKVSELLAFTASQKEHWWKIWSNNIEERLNREIRRRSDAVGIFPNRPSIIWMVGCLLLQQNDYGS